MPDRPPPDHSPPIVMRGAPVADRWHQWVAQRVAELKSLGCTPGLSVVLVGDDPSSKVYVEAKRKLAEKLGFHARTHKLGAGTDQHEVAELLERLAQDGSVHGMLLQLPLPGALNAPVLQRLIPPAKDVDGCHPWHLGRVYGGNHDTLPHDTHPPVMTPCTPMGCLAILDNYRVPIRGKNALVVGRSLIVGRPLAALLMARDATVTVAHSRTVHLEALCRNADILAVAMGVPNGVPGEWIKPGAAVLDIGIHRINDPSKPKGYRLRGDIGGPIPPMNRAAWITPVPGGVGPTTVAGLMVNTVRAALWAATGQTLAP